MTQETANLFELIRREGLIVVAIAALAWQVYWLTTQASAEDSRWRTELAAYREAADQRTQQRLEAVRDLTKVITAMHDRLGVIERVTSDIEEECQIFQVREQLREQYERSNMPPQESRR